MEILESIDARCWQGPFSPDVIGKAADALETGKMLYAPQLAFDLSTSERRFLSPDCLDGKSKNVSFRPSNGVLKEHDTKEPIATSYLACCAATTIRRRPC